MLMTQVADLVNDATREVLGEEATLLTEDLSNVVDVGNEIFNARATDHFVNALADRIGKVIFVIRKYEGGSPSVLMDSWEYGAVLQKIASDIPEAKENESFELVDGESYDPNIFSRPKVTAKYFDKRVTLEIKISVAELQVKSAFLNGTQLNAFVSMLFNDVEKSMTIKTDALIMRTINSFIGETIYDEYADGTQSTKSGIRAVNLLYLFNEKFDKELTADECYTDPEFIRFSSFMMGNYTDRLKKASRLFNMGGLTRFTGREDLHFVLLSEFARAADVYLQSDTFNERFTEFPKAEIVPYWQGTGDDYDFENTSAIDLVTGNGHEISASGILGVMFDRDALGVAHLNKRVTSNWVPNAEFWNYWHKFDAAYFNDYNENFVVFFVA